MLPASDSTNGRFAIVRRGYDIDQVESYLTGRETQYEQKLEEAAARIGKLEGELDQARRKEEAVTLTLVAATKTKDEMLESAKRKLDEATSEAQAQADKILADAQYEAFRLVNEAKETAETAISEATAEAEATVSGARQESVAILDQIKEESENFRTAHEQDLANARARFEEENAELTQRIAMLRNVAGDLERRLQALARGALDDLMGMTGLLTEGSSTGQGVTATPPAKAPAADDDHNEEDGPHGSPQRRSFYSRRSAKLPRIGSDAGRSALAAASVMRSGMHHDHDDDDAAARPSENLAVQSASA